LTRGSLYPLALAGVEVEEWIKGTFLTKDEVHVAWKLSAFLHAQSTQGRDKVTLLLPTQWQGAALWTKQDFEESLGKSEKTGIKIVIGEMPKLANYRSPKEQHQDRVFLAVQQKGSAGPDRGKLALVKRLGYPLAVLTLPPTAPLSAYMQFIHYAVFGLGYLRDMNFVTQPSVELYKAITSQIAAESARDGGIEKSREWQRLMNPATTLRYRGGISLHYPHQAQCSCLSGDAPEVYAKVLACYAGARSVESGELTYFGDTRYSNAGKKLRRVLDHAAERVFRSRLRMPVDVYEGPAMNHSYHEMIIGHGRCFSTVLLSTNSESIPAVNYTADYHKAQFLATQSALAERGRSVVALLLRDLQEPTLVALEDFFREVAAHLKFLKARS
jgi:hypothetical protein